MPLAMGIAIFNSEVPSFAMAELHFWHLQVHGKTVENREALFAASWLAASAVHGSTRTFSPWMQAGSGHPIDLYAEKWRQLPGGGFDQLEGERRLAPVASALTFMKAFHGRRNSRPSAKSGDFSFHMSVL